ncbi:MAG: lamin tail domain-containing protein [Bacteroidetes bacterium]|nr:lamin tail domain-containing protein [Bacteroidota bacterium]
MRYYLTLLLFVVSRLSSAQFSDDFSDGDFTNAPAWSGMTANFEVNGSGQLHLLAPALDDTSYLAVPTTNIATTWDFFVRMEFNPSSSNLARIYLVSDNANLTGSLNGYFVLVGNTTDEISLYRQTGTTVTEILDGVDGTVNTDPVNVRIRVTRDVAGNWEVFRDLTGGYSFTSEGTVTDNTYSATSYFGVFCKYTSTRSQLFYFDNLGDPYIDALAPTVLSVTPVSATQLDVQFSEPLNQVLAETLSNYSVNNGIGTPSTALLDGVDPSLVHLTFATAFSNAVNYELTLNNLEDLAGNVLLSPTVEPFFYFVPDIPAANEVIITEIMADPTPVVGLPEVEFIEIYNRSAKYFDISGWTIGDATSNAAIGSYVLTPGSYVIICGLGDDGLFATSNKTVAALPAYNNDADAVVLKDNLGNMLDSVYFDLTWYDDAVKDDGGWTLERKHNDAPCSDQNNWSASVDVLGGTPGSQNSIWTNSDDSLAPQITSFDVISAGELVVYFDQNLDTLVPAGVTISPAVTGLYWNYSALNALHIFPTTLVVNILYDVTVSLAADCWGNVMNPEVLKLGLPDSIEPEDLILNEVMFNPLTNGSDYVEIYNRSEKILDLDELYLANWDDSIANYENVSSDQRLIMPGEYVLLTEDSTDIQNDFSIYGVGTFQDMDLPTYNDDSGSVYLISKDFGILDYLQYNQDMHYDLITDKNGKALERITFEGGMNNPDNWHTAAENVEWGTPGYENSQLMYPAVTGTVSLTPEIFSPDNDGNNDILTINLLFENTDNVVNIEIFDNRGRRIKELKDSYYVGNSALVTWDGSTDEGTKASIGTYVILVSVLEADGSRSEYKLACVVAGQF